MMFDAHTRIWGGPESMGPEATEAIRRCSLSGTIEFGSAALERELESFGAVAVLGFRSSVVRASVPNELLADLARRHPSRVLGVAGVDPLADGSLEDLERSRSLGLHGISISPSMQGFHPAHSSAMRIYERCESWGWPVWAVRPFPLCRSAVMEFDRPSAWDEVARSFPKLTIVLGELGHPWTDEALALCAKHRCVYTETSGVIGRPWQLYSALLQANALGTLDKLLFGSGYPLAAPAKAIEALYSANGYALGTMLPSIPRAALRAIAERDIAGLVGYPAPLSHPTRAATPRGSSREQEHSR